MSAIQKLALSESGFVFDPRTGHSYSVNATGLSVLRSLGEGVGVDEAIERLGTEFDVDGSKVEDDVREFLAVLQEYGLDAGAVRRSGEEE